MISAEAVSGWSSHRTGCLFHTLYCLLLLWSREIHGLSDFSNYLFRIINSHSARAHDGDMLLLTCPRHSTISVQSAVYEPHKPLTNCSASAALQKMLSECQGHRNCQVMVHAHLFGQDPCPGTLKHLQVSYSCKPTEHKNRTRCEGDRMLLHCKFPKLLNIYFAIYGRELGKREACLTEEEQSPPFECLYYGAIDVVKRMCYGKQRCLLAVDDEHFRNPCTQKAQKYLTVLYSCVPQSLFKEADPNFFRTTPVPEDTTKTKNPEMAGLLFISSVCLGLLIVLLAISVKLTCTKRLEATSLLTNKEATEEPRGVCEHGNTCGDDDDDDDGDELEPLIDISLMSEIGRKVYCWEEPSYTTEAAELMERLERREMIIQEIRMNSFLNGNSCALN